MARPKRRLLVCSSFCNPSSWLRLLSMAQRWLTRGHCAPQMHLWEPLPHRPVPSFLLSIYKKYSISTKCQISELSFVFIHLSNNCTDLFPIRVISIVRNLINSPTPKAYVAMSSYSAELCYWTRLFSSTHQLVYFHTSSCLAVYIAGSPRTSYRLSKRAPFRQSTHITSWVFLIPDDPG